MTYFHVGSGETYDEQKLLLASSRLVFGDPEIGVDLGEWSTALRPRITCGTSFGSPRPGLSMNSMKRTINQEDKLWFDVAKVFRTRPIFIYFRSFLEAFVKERNIVFQ